ncbi:hypothetical protein F5J12DRAFT_710427 [Pisolithus orientalis]|uniref:uncharacterized protein n=1 Tax=Pisolithus orientalis TaxID=936130 RepID=UPI00222417C1|nr:uncharacterized protein F5J12DRAFT_710427 [Pisolithus orientalis]KAI6035218.1 hypothetical protein F5J12DRAFT_710427 [Pisolithus orientalis]
MSASARRLGEEADRAYAIQVAAGTKVPSGPLDLTSHGNSCLPCAQSAAVYGVLGFGAVTIAHYTWPFFRHQTLAFKSFLVSTSMVFGLAIGADSALLSHEAERRRSENAVRRQAVLELSRRGMVPTETAIAKWRADKAQYSSANRDEMG